MKEKLFNLDNQKLLDVEHNLKVIEENINKAVLEVGKKREDIILLSATKTVDVETINFAISKGLKYIGENKVQEMLSKYDDYDLDNATLHFIGHLQSNKVRQIVGKVKMIQSVDSLKLATEISKQSIKNNIDTDILIEVNIGDEESKSGVQKQNLEELLCQISTLSNIKVRGLMTIPPICDKKSEIRKYFSLMNKLFIDIRGKKIDNISMDFLSMGMSSDYYEAILEGSNMVRIGSSLFGERIYI